MLKTLIRKTVELVFVMLAATLITFVLTCLSPGDPAQIYFDARGISPSTAELEAMRSSMGLDQPVVSQYFNWVMGILQQDAGVSLRTGEPVAELVHQRFFMTLKLALLAIILMLVFALPLGIGATLYEGRAVDYLIRACSFAAVSMPEFWLGLILILVFIVDLQWFKLTDPYAAQSLVLPAITLAIPLIGRYTRQLHAMLSEEMTKGYVVGARARGCREPRIVVCHVLPNVLGGLTTLFGLSCALLLGGTVIVETIFALPGLGTMAIEAIAHRDHPVLQAYVLLMVFIYVVINFVVDVAAEWLDPRLGLSGGRP